MNLSIIQYPNKILRQKARPVDFIDEKIKTLAKQIMEMIKVEQGVGLAAPQVGQLIRLIVCDVGQGPIVLVNPEITNREGEKIGEEGCLSLPGLYLPVKRAEKIEVKFLDLTGKEVLLKTKNLLARVIQHEIDHLDGILLIDYLPWWQRIKIKKKLILRV